MFPDRPTQMRALSSLFRRKKLDTAPLRGSPATAAVSAYASVDPGIPLRPVAKIIDSNEDLLHRVRLTYGCDRETFERNIVSVVNSYAAYCHLLPATPDNYFNDQGGLFRMGLEIAFFALQGTDGHIFAGAETISQRAQLEPRWRYATFIAGLLSEVHRTLSHVIITCDDGREWPAYLEPLTTWAGRRVERYYLRWRPRPVETRALGLFAARHVIRPETLQYLADGNNVIVPQMLSTIGGLSSHRDPNLIERLVRTCTAVVIQNNLSATASRYGRPLVGSHLERYLVDAMQRLVACGAWLINEPKSRLWFSTDGLFLVWPSSVNDIVHLLDQDRVPGIPKSPDTIAEILMAAQVFRAHADGGSVHQIAPPGAAQRLGAVQLASPMVLLTACSQLPKALAVPIAVAAAPSMSVALPAATVVIEPPSPAPPAHSSLDLFEPEASPPPGDDDDSAVAPPGEPDPDTSSTRIAGTRPGASGRSLPQADEAANAAASAARFELRAPIHLNPAVRAALAQIVETLNAGAAATCCTVPQGLFVPLSEFKRHALDTAIAVRSLFDAGMLAQGEGGTRTVHHRFDGAQTLGVCVLPQYVLGFDPAAFKGASG